MIFKVVVHRVAERERLSHVDVGCDGIDLEILNRTGCDITGVIGHSELIAVQAV